MTEKEKLLRDINIEPFRIHVDDRVLTDLRERLSRARWPNEPRGAGWRFGTDLTYLREFVAHWRNHYDWRKWEAKLNAFPQFRTEIGGVMVRRNTNRRKDKARDLFICD
jgi:epoxide hydrolase